MENPNQNDVVIEPGRENFVTGQFQPGSINKNFVVGVGHKNASNFGSIEPHQKSIPLFYFHAGSEKARLNPCK